MRKSSDRECPPQSPIPQDSGRCSKNSSTHAAAIRRRDSPRARFLEFPAEASHHPCGVERPRDRPGSPPSGRFVRGGGYERVVPRHLASGSQAHSREADAHRHAVFGGLSRPRQQSSLSPDDNLAAGQDFEHLAIDFVRSGGHPARPDASQVMTHSLSPLARTTERTKLAGMWCPSVIKLAARRHSPSCPTADSDAGAAVDWLRYPGEYSAARRPARLLRSEPYWHRSAPARS